MIPGSGMEGLQIQMRLGHSDELFVGIADRINEAFLDPSTDMEGAVRGVCAPFCAYMPVYILKTQKVFCNDNVNSYLTSVTKTRFLQSQLGMLSGR